MWILICGRELVGDGQRVNKVNTAQLDCGGATVHFQNIQMVEPPHVNGSNISGFHKNLVRDLSFSGWSPQEFSKGSE